MDAPIPPLNANPSTPPATPTPPAVPPAAAPAPTPPPPAPPQPASPPTAKPPQENSGLWWKLLILVAVLLALGVLAYSIWGTVTAKPTVSTLPPANFTTPTSTGNTASSTPGTGTQTASTTVNGASNNYGFASEDTYPFGQPVQIFGNDNDLFRDATRALGVRVIQFTDSRCPTGQTCVWAGEQGVHLEVTNELTGQMQEVDLGTVTAPSVAALGATFQLNEINTGKGGTSATITVK